MKLRKAATLEIELTPTEVECLVMAMAGTVGRLAFLREYLVQTNQREQEGDHG